MAQEAAKVSDLHVILRRWKKYHGARDFSDLYDALFPIVEKRIAKYPEEIRGDLRSYAIGAFVQALDTYRGKQKIETWVFHYSTRINRKAGMLMYPGVPESRWPRFSSVPPLYNQ